MTGTGTWLRIFHFVKEPGRVASRFMQIRPYACGISVTIDMVGKMPGWRQPGMIHSFLMLP